MNENELAKIVFEAGLTVHRALGPGLLESVYEKFKNGVKRVKNGSL